MYYYAYVNDDNICQDTYGFPSQITDAHYIYLGTEDDKSVVGKQWNGTTWVEVVNYYYAQLNEKDIVVAVVELPAETTDPKFIRINPLDESLKGKWYNGTTFVEAPIHILADHSTDVVNYRAEDKWLSDKIDEKADSTNVYTKAESDAKYALIGSSGTGSDGLSAYQIAVNNGFVGTEQEWLASLQGTDGIDGIDGEDGLSAYQIAVNNGFVGTEAQWLESLHGEDGTSATDADTLDGKHASDFANATHTHAIGDVANLQTTLDGKASTDHTHSTYALVDHTHSEYAPVAHTHSQYATITQLDGKADTNHTHGGYAPSTHYHTISDITNLQSTLNGKASTSHTHSGYASSSHTHSDYFSKSGGAISGDVSISGIVRVGGQQCIYNSGSMVTLSTNNLSTMIAGSSIYSKVAISVSSDKRLKRDITNINTNEVVDFIKSLNVVNYRYKDNDDKHMGVIAQEVIKSNPKLAELFVKKGEDGYLSVNISELIFPLIAVVQELLKRK